MLDAGTLLGPYEIVAPIGAGGMGEVYRARDTRLGREVAVKIVHARFASDPEQLRRFEQEARAASLLTHPNILVVHDLGTHDGSPYIVSELLAGESLREKLGAPLPPRKALEYAVQIAHGLAAAHEQGIVHRDLKPENVFVTRDGRIKILDFGVAKLTERAQPSESLTRAVTAAGGTEPGMIVGTVGYMSPEQVLGKPVDARSDIFALGVVLYEMLAGQRPFRKDSAPETMAAILREEPAELTATNAAVPLGVDRIARHCLEKEPSNRFQSARDVAFALESLSQSTTSVAAPLHASGRARRLAFAALGLVLLAGWSAGLYLWSGRANQAPPRSYQRLTFRRGFVGAARFAPEGQTVVYSAAWEGGPNEVFSVRLDSPESRPLGYSPAELLAVSPTSELALSLDSRQDRSYWAWTGTLARVPFSGGTPKASEERVTVADWSPDGKELALVRETDKGSQLEYPAGHVLHSTAGANSISFARVSPTGDLVAFAELGDGDGGSIAVVDRKGQKRALAEKIYWGARGLAWSPKGDEVWFTAARTGWRQDLLAVSLDGRQRLVLGESVSIRLLDVAKDGRVLITHEQQGARCFFRGEKDSAERELSWLDYSGIQGLSKDGRRAILNETNPWVGANGVQAYIRETNGAPPMILGPGQGWGFSPDERFVVVNSFQSPAIILYPVGTGQAQTIPVKGIVGIDGPSMLPDGETLVFQGSEPSSGLRIWLTDLSGTKPRHISPEGVGLLLPLNVTPDGRFILGVGAGGGQPMMYPVSVSGGDPQPFKGFRVGDQLAGWGADGLSYFATNTNTIPLTFYRVDLKTGERRVVREITPTDKAGRLLGLYGYTTPDGKNYAYTMVAQLSELHLITGLR
jgi:eukaryotic-like serine/threonine-protein kinase